jgi:glycerol-3-phosphate O-acyltransferase
MMAFDRTPSRPALEPETVESLRKALATSVAQGNHVDNLRDLLCRAASDARAKGMQAEQLLVTLKDIWYSMPEVTSASSAAVENTLLQELISRCIQEYYAL